MEAFEAAEKIAARNDVDWDQLQRLGRRGGVAPLLYHTAREHKLLPTALEQELRVDYLSTAGRNLGLFQQLERILEELKREAVSVTLLKGAALAGSVYENLALRPMADIDLLVWERDVPAALRALQSAGYNIVPPTAYRCEVMAQSPGGLRALVELHWSLFVPFYYQYRIPMDWFWQTARHLDVGEASAKALGPEAQLLHLCGHLYLHHGAREEPNLLWLYDVAAVIATYRQQIDWDEVVARCQLYELVLPVQRTLRQVADRWGPPIPPAVLEQLLGLRASDREERVLARLTRGRAAALQHFRAELAEIPSCTWRFRFVWRNLFPPPGYMRQIYGVPHPFLLTLYYPYRWILGLRRATD